MQEKTFNQQTELAKAIERHTGTNGNFETDIPSMFFVRRTIDSEPNYGVYKPSLCIMVQGTKEVSLGTGNFRYGPGDYLVATVELPVTNQIVETSPENPYLAFILELNTNQILEVLGDVDISSTLDGNSE